MHPTTHLVVWLLLLVASQCLQGDQLMAALCVLPFFGRAALQRGARLVWRTRWLFLSLFVILAWGAAGEPLWSGVLAPTHEGLVDASTHSGRLLLALLAVAVLLDRMPVPDLLSATHHLLQPLHRCGVNPERGVVRLLLVLRYLETMPRPRDWRALLNAPASHGDEVLELADRRFSCSDVLLMLLVAGVVGTFCLRQG